MVMQMARTNNLRKLVKKMLSDATFTEKHGVKGVYFENGDDKAMYPHIIFSFDQIGTGDLWRHDVSLIIDIYTKGTSATNGIPIGANPIQWLRAADNDASSIR